MPNIESSSGPFKDLIFVGHDSVEAYDTEAGKPGSCLADADGAIVTWNCLPIFGNRFVPIFEKLTGSTRLVDEKKTAKAKAAAKPDAVVADVYETPVVFFTREFAKLDDQQKAAVSVAARDLALTIKVDASPSARGARGPSKDLLAKADSVLALSEDKREEKLSKWAAALDEASLPPFDLERDEQGVPTRESLAYFAGEVLKVA